MKVMLATLIAVLKHHCLQCKYLLIYLIYTCSLERILGGKIFPEEPNEGSVKLFVISFIYLFHVKVFQEDIVQKNSKCEF